MRRTNGKEAKGVMLKKPKYVAGSAMKGITDPGHLEGGLDQCPTSGAHDEGAPLGRLRAIVLKLAPKAEYRVIDEARHFRMLEKPEAFNKTLASFYRSIASTKGVSQPPRWATPGTGRGF